MLIQQGLDDEPHTLLLCSSRAIAGEAMPTIAAVKFKSWTNELSGPDFARIYSERTITIKEMHPAYQSKDDLRTRDN